VTLGTVYWITGLSGAGKSTVASLLADRLRARQRPVLQLDGDILREIFSPGAGHDPEDRLRLARAYGRLCREVATQGIDVVCATISMFHAVRRWNRDNIPGYREIYLSVPLAELQRRDSKGLYRRARQGSTRNVVGVDLHAELPEAPDLTVENHGISPEAAVDRIWSACVRTG
jgi:adenylylsulfate kinase